MQFAYLLAEETANESWSGGLLITDDCGLPIDFRYVEPIRPGKLQRLIYGHALKRYLMLDAIALTLLKAASPRVEWVFTGDDLLLELEGKISGRFVSISNGEKEPMNSVGEWRTNHTGSIFLQVSPSGPPVTLSFNADDDQSTNEIASQLAGLTEKFDFVEPLSRVSTALKEICSGKTD